ncbi:MAG: hypothetical protein NW206_19065 [Hyphomonadaceae bacterium]|nr:hypothetical protein [Hyphomonadaceae bacterium]
MLSRLAAALVFLTGVALMTFADVPFIRYASVALEGPKHCYVNQAQNLPEHMNVLVLGSSRLWAGVDPTAVTEASGGRLANVYNLSAPGMHVVRSASVFDEILRSNRQVDVVVVEMRINALRRGRPRPWFWDTSAAGRATWLDILTKTPRLLANGAAPDPRTVLQGLHLKLQQAILTVTTGAAATALINANDEPTPLCRGDYFFEETASSSARQQDFGDLVRRRFPNPETDFDRAFRGPQGDAALGDLQLLEHIRASARAAGVKVLVVRPQSYAEPALDPQVVQKLTELIPEYRYPPERIARRLNQLVFDGTHYGPEGRLLFSRWLAQTILAEESAADPAAQ